VIDLPDRNAVRPNSLWRPLRFFAIYRWLVAVIFLVAALTFGEALNIGTQNFALFRSVSLIYAALATLLLMLLLAWPRRFEAQLSLQVTVDVIALTLMMFASGGQKSGIAALLLVVVSGAGLVGQGRMVLFYAALASVAVLLEESWRALTGDADPADFVRTGIICIAFFAAAVAARLLARRAVANEQLAHDRGRQLDAQLRIGERIVRDMEDGVLVIDPAGRVRLSNPQARILLNTPINIGEHLPTPLADRYPAWQATHAESIELMNSATGRHLRVRYLPPADVHDNSLLYIEDMEKVHFHAQQLKLAALGRLAANMAHEIRNPLASISHATELLSEDEQDPLRLRLARIAMDNTARLNQLVTETLELGRRDRAMPEMLAWPAFIQEFLEEFTLHDASAIRRIHLNGQIKSILFDPHHLHRVLWNLLDNALRYASQADGAVMLRLRSTKAGRVVLDILDDGPGIPPALRLQVFEPFFTTHATGTGLGLYIARELCAANNAQLELLESPRGAHFQITAEGKA
jgi:two-component system sensor histidine kinase PilS (NtrC family)